MRKSEREIADVHEKFAALLRCGYMTLAVEGEGAPYCVPLNFGAELAGDTLVLYFHCAKEGKKLDLLRKNPRVGFSAANMLRVFNKGAAPCGYGNSRGRTRPPARPASADEALFGGGFFRRILFAQGAFAHLRR